MVFSLYLYDAMPSLKTSVSNGKSAVASAITDKGVSTSATATFDTMASNIRSISSSYTVIDHPNIRIYSGNSKTVELSEDSERILYHNVFPVLTDQTHTEKTGWHTQFSLSGNILTLNNRAWTTGYYQTFTIYEII